jgi:AhpD family alkylhydroperoxidase
MIMQGGVGCRDAIGHDRSTTDYVMSIKICAPTAILRTTLGLPGGEIILTWGLLPRLGDMWSPREPRVLGHAVITCVVIRKEQEMSYGKAVREELRMPARELRHAIPRVYDGYRQLHRAALAAGALDIRTKELIALAIAVSKKCDGCMAAHAHVAVLHGATPAEAAEAIGVTFVMNGDPATVYGARAFAAFQEFYAERARQPDGH